MASSADELTSRAGWDGGEASGHEDGSTIRFEKSKSSRWIFFLDYLCTSVHRFRDELAYILERCNIRILAERLGSHRQMSSFMLREGSFLLKQPDIVIPDLDGPRTFTLIDIKIFDPAAPSYADSSAKSAQHRHRALEVAGPREYFGASRRPPPGSRMRICTFVVTSFGSWLTSNTRITSPRPD